MVVTGEDLPSNEASVLARLLVIPFNQPANLEKLTYCQRHAHLLPGIMAKFIHEIILNRWDEEYVCTMAETIRNKVFDERFHKKIPDTVALNAVGFELFARFMKCEDLIPIYYEKIAEATVKMGEAIKEEKACNIFLTAVEDLISAGRVYLAGAKGSSDTEHTETATKIGWTTPEWDYLLGSVALSEANKFRLASSGSGIKYSITAIYDQLTEERILVPSSGKSTQTIRIDGATHRVVKIKKGILTGMDDERSVPEDYSECSPSGIAEDCAEALN